MNINITLIIIDDVYFIINNYYNNGFKDIILFKSLIDIIFEF
jgi:hypothetical protein